MSYNIELALHADIGHLSNAVYIGRGSILGNPFPITASCSRDYVCDQYEVYFREQLRNDNPQFLKALVEIHQKGIEFGTVYLGCFCRPGFRCHGMTIKHWIEQNLDYLNDLC